MCRHCRNSEALYPSLGRSVSLRGVRHQAVVAGERQARELACKPVPSCSSLTFLHAIWGVQCVCAWLRPVCGVLSRDMGC